MYKQHGLAKWIIIWLVISMLIVFWDVMFILLRPYSFADGYLGFLWTPYAKYIKIDKSYADMNNAFVVAQSIMSLLEILIVISALFFNYVGKWLTAYLFAFSSQLLTGSKTILIFMLEIASGLQHVGHNNIEELILYYILPNSIWIVMPIFVVMTIGQNLTACE